MSTPCKVNVNLVRLWNNIKLMMIIIHMSTYQEVKIKMDWNFHHPHYHSPASHKQQQHLCVFHFHQQPKDHWDQYFLATLKWLGIVEAKK